MEAHADFLTRFMTFLKAAHKRGYGNADAPQATPIRPGWKAYHFELGSFTYHDEYHGNKRYFGEEVITENGEAVWGMNYYGEIMLLPADQVTKKEIYTFLRNALMATPTEYPIPVRGPLAFEMAGTHRWSYIILYRQGDTIGSFAAEEQIRYDGKLVYRGVVHGGFIED
jgi:hypothetical protein